MKSIDPQGKKKHYGVLRPFTIPINQAYLCHLGHKFLQDLLLFQPGRTFQQACWRTRFVFDSEFQKLPGADLQLHNPIFSPAARPPHHSGGFPPAWASLARSGLQPAPPVQRSAPPLRQIPKATGRSFLPRLSGLSSAAPAVCRGDCTRTHGCKMALCQGLSAGNAQLLAFPGRSSSLKRTQLHVTRNHFSARALQVGTDSIHHGMPTTIPRENSVKGIPSLSARHNRHPRWWWRTLACVPYLLPLHNMWSYADVIYQLHTYLQGFSLLYTFIDTMTLCPGWLFLVIFMTVYFFVVRRKWSPHFLRFHVILAILLDTGSQAVATMCTWMPSIVYQGKPMQYFWMSIAFIQIFTVLECMRCALCGMYPNVPFISHTAFIHSDLNLFR
ncbi:unnamed protein product [Urochloa humidicola]